MKKVDKKVYERKIFTKVAYPANVDFDCGTLAEIKQNVENLIAEYGEDAQFANECQSNYVLCIYYHMTESDEEYNKRIQEYEQKLEKQKEKDLKELARLKSIYEK